MINGLLLGSRLRSEILGWRLTAVLGILLEPFINIHALVQYPDYF